MRPTHRAGTLVLAATSIIAACSEPVTEPSAAPGPSLAARGAADQAGGGAFMVMARSNSLPESLADQIGALGGTVVREIPQIGVLVAYSEDSDFAANVSRLSTVQTVVPDQLMEFEDPTMGDALVDHSSLSGAGFFDALTWGIDAVGAPAAWAAGNRGAGVRVAVLDAGIDMNHPDVAPNVNVGLSTSFVPCIISNCDGAVEDWRITPGFYFNHGTHVAGTIAANGNLGVTGVAPEAELMVVKVCTEFFNACFTSAIVSGLVHAADADADLVNMSIGGLRRMRNDFVPFCRSLGIPTRDCGRLARFFVTQQDDFVHNTILVYKRALEYAHRQGTTVIVAAGNNAMDADHNKDIKLVFGDFPHTIAVSALGPLGWCIDPSTSTDEPAYYTNTGRSIVDVAAPGGSFFGSFLGPPYTDPCSVGPLTRSAYVFDGVFSTIAGGWGWAQGTSMAAPHTTGVAALLIHANGGSMSPAQVEQALKAAAVDLGEPGHDAVYGSGRVSAGY